MRFDPDRVDIPSGITERNIKSPTSQHIKETAALGKSS